MTIEALLDYDIATIRSMSDEELIALMEPVLALEPMPPSGEPFKSAGPVKKKPAKTKKLDNLLEQARAAAKAGALDEFDLGEAKNEFGF